MNIGERIQKLRKEANLSQEEVANQINVSRQTISKWELGESNPDFDKIVPLCELFHISTDELIKGIKSEMSTEGEEKEKNKKTAFVVAISVFLYFLSIIWIIAMEPLQIISDELLVSIFLLICAIPTCLLIYHFLSKERSEKRELELKEKKKFKKIDSIVGMVFTVIYLLISFATMRWDITWILWIVYAIVLEIIHLILGDKEEN